MRDITTRFFILAMAVISLMTIAGCGGGSGSDKSFTVHTTATVNGMSQDDPGVLVGGRVPTGVGAIPHVDPVTDCGVNPGGHASFDPVNTDSAGHHTVTDPLIGPNCLWLIDRDASPLCPVQTFNSQHIVNLDKLTIPPPCGVNVNTFTANPSKIDPGLPPATVTLTGQNMTSTYAMPEVRLYDPAETLHLEVTALSASPDGTTLVFSGNQLTFTGRFAATVYVMDANGNWNAVGGAAISIEPPPPPPPDPPPCSPHQDCGLSKIAI